MARPRRLHLEHQDGRRPRPDRRHAPRDPLPGAAEGLVPLRTGDRRTGRRGGVDRLRDRRGPRLRAPPAPGRQGLHPAHHHGRAEGSRGAARPSAREGRRPRDHQGPSVLAGAQDRGGRGSRRLRAAVRRHRRRRPGRHRPRCPAQAPRHPDRDPREERPRRRLVAEAVQVAPPARPGLVRPPAVPQVPRALAGVRRQGQARRLARALRRADGAELLDPLRVPQRAVGRGRPGVGRHGRPRRHGRGAPAEAARHRPRGQRVPEPADVCRSGRLPRRAAPLVRLPGRRRIRRQERRGRRVEQLGVRHLRGRVGGRRQPDDGAAVEHAPHQERVADGPRARRPLLRARRWRTA